MRQLFYSLDSTSLTQWYGTDKKVTKLKALIHLCEKLIYKSCRAFVLPLFTTRYSLSRMRKNYWIWHSIAAVINHMAGSSECCLDRWIELPKKQTDDLVVAIFSFLAKIFLRHLKRNFLGCCVWWLSAYCCTHNTQYSVIIIFHLSITNSIFSSSPSPRQPFVNQCLRVTYGHLYFKKKKHQNNLASSRFLFIKYSPVIFLFGIHIFSVYIL